MKKKTPAEIKKEKADLKAYLKAVPREAKAHLTKIRAIVRAVAPAAVDGMSYKMPAYRYDGRLFVFTPAFRDHCSLYPITRPLQRRFAKELKGWKVTPAGPQFPFDRPVPAGLIHALVKARLADVKAGAGMRGPKKR